MAPVKRITPEVDFPETQGGSQVYGTAWPLSEYFYLCVYDPEGAARRGTKNNFGIYLVDAFGNKDFIYKTAKDGFTLTSPVKNHKTGKPETYTYKTK